MYFKTCCLSFSNPKYFKWKNLAAKKDANLSETSDESVIDFVIKEILGSEDKTWNSVKIYDVYIEYNDNQHLASNKNRSMKYMNYYKTKYIYSSLLELLQY